MCIRDRACSGSMVSSIRSRPTSASHSLNGSAFGEGIDLSLIHICEGFSNLKDGRGYDNLYQSALCRAKADWLIGINATRLFSILYHKTLNVGRVQTPTPVSYTHLDVYKRQTPNTPKAGTGSKWRLTTAPPAASPKI